MAGSFSMQLNAFTEKAQKGTVSACQKIAIDLWGKVIYRSPVGDPANWSDAFKAVGIKLGWFDKNYVGGRFRANWGVQIGSPYQGVTDTRDKTGGPTHAKAESDTAAWNGKKAIYLCNNLPYSIVLERGHSHTQAPQGMVRISVAEMANGGGEAAAK